MKKNKISKSGYYGYYLGVDILNNAKVVTTVTTFFS